MTSPPDAHMRANMSRTESKSPDDTAVKLAPPEGPPSCKLLLPACSSNAMNTEAHGEEVEKASEVLPKDEMALDAPEKRKRANPDRIPRILSSLSTVLNHPDLVHGCFKSDPSERKAKRSAAVASVENDNQKQVAKAQSKAAAGGVSSAKVEAHATSTRSGRRVNRQDAGKVSVNKGRAIAFVARNRKSKQTGAQASSERRPKIQFLKSQPTKKARKDTASYPMKGLSISVAGNGPKNIVTREFHSKGSSLSSHPTSLQSASDLATIAGLAVKPSVPELSPMSATVTVLGAATNRIHSPRHCFPVVNVASESVQSVAGATSFALVRGLDSHDWKNSDNATATVSMTDNIMMEGPTNGGDLDQLAHRLAGTMPVRNTIATTMDLANTRQPTQASIETSPSRVTPELEPLKQDASSSLATVHRSSSSPPSPAHVDADQSLPSLEMKDSLMSPVPLSVIAKSSQYGYGGLISDEEMQAFLEDILASGGKALPMPPLDDRPIESEQLFDPVGSTFLPMTMPSQDEEPH